MECGNCDPYSQSELKKDWALLQDWVGGDWLGRGDGGGQGPALYRKSVNGPLVQLSRKWSWISPSFLDMQPTHTCLTKVALSGSKWSVVKSMHLPMFQ